MGRAGERDLLVGQAVLVRDAALDQGQGLQRLDGGARENAPVHVADRQNRSPLRIDHRDAAPMARLDQVPAGDLDKKRIVHQCPD